MILYCLAIVGVFALIIGAISFLLIVCLLMRERVEDRRMKLRMMDQHRSFTKPGDLM